MKDNTYTSTATISWEPPKTIWNFMFISIFFANMAFNMGQQMSNSLLSMYAKSVGTPADQIGQLMSMFAVTALIFRFISGPAMNSFNRKKLLTMAMLLMATAYVGFSFSPVLASKLGVETVLVMKAFRLLQGIGNAFGNSCCLTIVADTLPKDKFSTGMGYYACAQVVSQAIGPTVGVMLRDSFGYNTTYLINCGVMLLAIAVVSMVRLAPRDAKPFKLNLDNMIAKEALIPATVGFLIHIGFITINSFLLLYAEERGIAGGSLFFTAYALALLLTRPVVGRLTEKHGFFKVSLPAVTMTVISLVLIGYSKNTFMLLAAAFLNAFGYGALQPMLQSLCMKSVTPDRRGSASSTNYIGLDIAALIGPTVCGKVAEIAGYTAAMWLVMTIPVLIGMLCIIIFRGRIDKIESSFGKKTENNKTEGQA